MIMATPSATLLLDQMQAGPPPVMKNPGECKDLLFGWQRLM